MYLLIYIWQDFRKHGVAKKGSNRKYMTATEGEPSKIESLTALEEQIFQRLSVSVTTGHENASE